ncbi:carbohydrate ABC transporter permease [Angustibacter sp. McL0619]|uniref:carbohydrate ABC transporter permease n=1 Tax=Angustibacter sp. McL0619 TaxID=3415676 RepID=UPI003CF9B56C
MRHRGVLLGTVSIVLFSVVFIVPFIFILLSAAKSPSEAAEFSFSLPTHWHLLDNLKGALQARDYILVIALINSTILTVSAVALLVVFSAMAAYVLQRRKSKLNPVVNMFVLAGLIIPPAVVPTIWVLQRLHLFRTMSGLIFVEVALGMAFCVLLFRAFISTIPRELDEAALIDGAGPIRLFFQVIFPLLRSVIVTVIVLQSVFVFNDFQNPLYFLPGDENATAQLTLFNFQSQFNTQYNLLFANMLLITVLPLVMFLFFNKRIVAGMTAGAVKG